MKNLRMALECGDMIASKSGLLSPEEELQDAGIGMIEDVSNQLEESVPSKISMESMLRHNPYPPIVLRKSYPVANMEALSETAVQLIVIVVVAVLTLIGRYLTWSKKSSSSSGGGGGGGSFKIRIERVHSYGPSYKEQVERLRKLNEELKHRKPMMQPPTPKNETKDLNSAPQPTPVSSVDDVIDVVYKDVKSHDKERFIDIGDPVLTDISENLNHWIMFNDLIFALGKTVKYLENLRDTIRGAVTHDIEKDLEVGQVRDVYKSSAMNFVVAVMYSSKGEKVFYLIDIARVMLDEWREQQSNTQIKQRSYMTTLENVLGKYQSHDFEMYLRYLEEGEAIITEIKADLERMREKLDKLSGDAESAPVVKQAVQQFRSWIATVGQFIAAFITIQHHFTAYEKKLHQSVDAFVRMGQHAFDEMYKGLEPHEKSEIQPAYEDVKQNTKEILKIGHSK